MKWIMALLIAVTSFSVQSGEPAVAEMDGFIDDLMSRMTLQEKIGQLNLVSSSRTVTGPSLRANVQQSLLDGQLGAVFNAYGADYTRRLQETAVKQTRLGIPLLFGYDVIHGHKTIFPISLGESASWDLQAIEKSARVAAREASSQGIHWTFAPMVDISRDPRWGRMSEGAGEDVYLGTQIAAARVRGFQGNDLAKTDTILATAKHYAAYGQAQAGRDYHSTDMSLLELHSTYLPPFKALVDAGVTSFMTSFNDLNGVPATANSYLLKDVLRDQWGFDGFVVTDYTAVDELVPHGFARDEAHAVELAMNAGVDMDMQGELFKNNLETLVKQDRVSVADIDRSVRRILEMKYRLGLFDDPYRYSDEARQTAEIYSEANLEASRDMARKSMVLLKNEGNLLPLSKDKISIALIGPLGDSKPDMNGSWAGAGERKERPVSVLEGLKAALGSDADIRFVKGADYNFGAAGERGFKAALDTANEADVVVLAMGEKWNMSGEAASRTSLTMPGNQLELMKQIKALGKPTVLVLFSGRAMNLSWEDENIDAILHTWYPGTMGGHAIADVLFGEYNPSAKLPQTFPRNVGQIPIYYNMKNTGRPYDPEGEQQKYISRYLDTPNTPLYPFGYGLSYTRFEYGKLQLSADSLTRDGALQLSVEVSNTGNYAGREVVQLYIQDQVGSITRPVKELKGFELISLAKGESRTVRFDITVQDLEFYHPDGRTYAEPGTFRVFVGGNSRDVLESGFSLVEAP